MSEHEPELFLGAIEALNDEIEAFQQSYVDEQVTLAAMLEARKALEAACDLLTAGGNFADSVHDHHIVRECGICRATEATLRAAIAKGEEASHGPDQPDNLGSEAAGLSSVEVL